MSDIIDVNTGEVKMGDPSQILTCRALGSCIAVIIADPVLNIGGIAHIMLPGKARESQDKYEMRYAENGIAKLLQELKTMGAHHPVACIVGAANVLRRPDDKICQLNIESVTKTLYHFNIPILKESLGGMERRSITYVVSKSKVYFTIGDHPQKHLFDFHLENSFHHHQIAAS